MAMNRLYGMALLCGVCLIGCGGNGSNPVPKVTIVQPTELNLSEAENPLVPITVTLDMPAPKDFEIPLEISGSAMRDQDYQLSATSLTLASGQTSASIELDVFRDFDAEGDETIVLDLGTLPSGIEPDTQASLTMHIIDGISFIPDKSFDIDEEPTPDLIPLAQTITESAVELSVVVLGAASAHLTELKVTAEWSSDPRFETDTHLLASEPISLEFIDDFSLFTDPHHFSLPLNLLASDARYYLRVRLDDGTPPAPAIEPGPELVLTSFATDAEGKVRTRCESSTRVADPSGGDPLFAQQWHLQNDGQSAFAQSGGVVGADLHMSNVLAAGPDGQGVKLAIVDSGLEICHPDLAGNVEQGKSFHFGFETNYGATPDDPFNPDILGDHGTSVAGIAAAIANNGLGGRGVAPGIAIRGFTPDSGEGDREAQFFASLGASEDAPDSASADVFNMSFGVEDPGVNASEDYVRLYQMGTSQLRGGRGALYVKAAGNSFDLCLEDETSHPLNQEIGCINTNTDPEQNLPYLITVGGFNADDVKSSYSSAGANLWVVAPAGEDGIEHPAIITTDQVGTRVGFSNSLVNSLGEDHALNRDGDYMSSFGGTSAATPAAAGAIAVLLSAYPDLTWRDVKHVLASTARKIDPEREKVRAAFKGTAYVSQSAWQTNAAGYNFHNWYGFGALALDDALVFGETFTPNSLGVFEKSPWFASQAGAPLSLEIPDADGKGATSTIEVSGLPASADVEAVVLELTVEGHDYASDLGVTLTSPSGMRSVLNPPFNRALDNFRAFDQWQLMSNAFYGESPEGTWTLQVVDLAEEDTGTLKAWRLGFYYGEHP